MKLTLYLTLYFFVWFVGGCVVGYLAHNVWRQLTKALDDVFQSPIHNPYNPENLDDPDYYGDIPNPVDRRHD